MKMKNNMKLITIVDRVAQVDEPALLVMSADLIGVTNEMGDVLAFISECQKENVAVKIIPGYKEDLLDLEHRVLLMDEVENSMGGKKITNPKRMENYNLIERTTQASNMLTQLGKGRIL